MWEFWMQRHKTGIYVRLNRLCWKWSLKRAWLRAVWTYLKKCCTNIAVLLLKETSSDGIRGEFLSLKKTSGWPGQCRLVTMFPEWCYKQGWAAKRGAAVVSSYRWFVVLCWLAGAFKAQLHSSFPAFRRHFAKASSGSTKPASRGTGSASFLC